MAKVLQVDCSTGGGDIEKDFGSNHSEAWLYADVAANAIALTALSGLNDIIQLSAQTFENCGAEWYIDTGPVTKWAAYNNGAGDPASTPFNPAAPVTSMQFYRVKIHLVAGTPITQEVWVDGVSIGTVDVTSSHQPNIRLLDLFQPGLVAPSGFLYFDNVKVGTTDGGTEIFADDFEGGDLSNWTSADAVFSVVDNPGVAAAGSTPAPAGRVWIAWDDGPLEPNPTWTLVDDPTGATFPKQFVAGFDIKVGRQTLISQTETGTATVYVNDHELGLFDDRNLSSPYQGKLSGRQIKLQLYNPVTATWEPQFRGLINDYSYTIDGSASDANGDPINASIQIECVDMFDYLNGYGLTPGLDGVMPPAGAEDGVYYAATAGPVHDRIVEILTDAGVDSTRYLVASGNTKVIAVKYDPGESALTALRDAADAEFPFISNIYVDRFGNFAFRGRYSRFNPDDVAAEPGSDWDFTRWAVGDEKAIRADPTRAQMRVLDFSRDRGSIINVAGCWTQNLPAADMPGQFFADTSSITAYGQHSAPPMSNLLTADYAGPGTITPSTGKKQCFLFAKLLVKNQAFPREAITALQVKAIHPDDYRAAETWAFITQSDISHIVNVRVGYPGGTGFTGTSPKDDYYIEGRSLVVRPLNPAHDYVEYNVEVSPAVWSMDTHSVFPPFANPS